ncbi:MAG: hypothetical protein NZ898_09395 [Myxococcota bacterium]|nr:hypothetical protein [Myxococcota bacterium]
MNERARSHTACLAGLFACVAAVGCFEDESRSPRPAPDTDGGRVGDGPAEADGGMSNDGGGRPSHLDGLPAAESVDRSDPELAAHCHYGLACRPEACAPVRSCCVGDGRCCGPAPEGESIGRIALEACGAGPAAGCLGLLGVMATPFGRPEPWVRDHALHPGGDAEYDSGLLLGRPIDLATRSISASWTFGGADGGCTGGCLESVWIGLTAQTTLGDASLVDAVVGVGLSGARREISVVARGEIVARWPFDGDRDGLETVALDVRADGTFEVRLPERAILHVGHHDRSVSRLVLWGRNRNPRGIVPGARVSNLVVDVRLCDIPDGFRTLAPVSIVGPDGRPWASPDVAAPSLAYGPAGETLLAFLDRDERGPVVRVARRGPGQTAFHLLSAHGELRPGRSHDRGGIADPDLVWDPAMNSWSLFYSARAEGEDGTRTIGRAVWSGSAGETFVADEAPVSMEVDALGGELVEPDVTAYHDGSLVMVSRRRAPLAGADSFAFHVSRDGGRLWTLVPSSGLSSIAAVADATTELDDGVFVGSPSLTIHDGAWWLHFERRVAGGRPAIGVLVSDELLHWRAPGVHVALLSDGQGIDRLGVAAPSFAVRERRAEMVVVALDGTRHTLALASRETTDAAAWALP